MCQSGDHNVVGLLRNLSSGEDPGTYTTLAKNFYYNRSFIIPSGRLSIDSKSMAFHW